MRLTQLIPTPRAVSIAGREYQVWPATLRDLRDLDGWLAQGWRDPLDDVYPRLVGPDALGGEERLAALHEAYEAAEDGPPGWENDRGQQKLSTDAGVAAVLFFALRRGHPEMTLAYEGGWDGAGPPDVVSLAVVLTLAEYAAVQRAWFGTDSLRELEALLYGRKGESGRRATFAEVVEQVVQTHPGWTYDYVYGLTLAEFGCARRLGKPPASSAPRPRGNSKEAWAEYVRMRSGKPPEELWPEAEKN